MFTDDTAEPGGVATAAETEEQGSEERRGGCDIKC